MRLPRSCIEEFIESSDTTERKHEQSEYLLSVSVKRRNQKDHEVIRRHEMPDSGVKTFWKRQSKEIQPKGSRSEASICFYEFYL